MSVRGGQQTDSSSATRSKDAQENLLPCLSPQGIHADHLWIQSKVGPFLTCQLNSTTVLPVDHNKHSCHPAASAVQTHQQLKEPSDQVEEDGGCGVWPGAATPQATKQAKQKKNSSSVRKQILVSRVWATRPGKLSQGSVLLYCH